jgi:hypothetical protein
LFGSESEEFEDTKGAMRKCILKKNRQHNGEKKSTKDYVTDPVFLIDVTT